MQHHPTIARLVASTTIAILSISAPALAAGALAVGHCGVDGYSYNQRSMQEAEDVALSECGPGCRVVLTMEAACAAFAVDTSSNCGAEGWGRDRERGGAEEIAVRECINQGGASCAVKRWVCDGG